MKTLKIVKVGLLFSGLLFFAFAAISFADEHSPQEIQKLKDAASALKTSNPDLSDRLSKYADKEAAEEDERENVGLLNSAASALQQSNPNLADTLKKYAEKEAQE